MAITPEERKKSMRGKIFASRKRKSVKVTFFDEELEIRQPSVRLLMSMTTEEDKTIAMANMLINYAYIPGTDIKIFDAEDMDQLLAMPFNEDWMAINKAIASMTGVEEEVKEEVKNLK